MHVTHADSLFVHVFGQILGHAFRQGGAQRAIAIGGHFADFVQQIIHLHFDGTNFDLWVNQAGGADHLFGKNTTCPFHFPFTRGRGDKNSLRTHQIPFFEFQRTVILTGWQSETKVGQSGFAARIPFIHGTDLADRHMAFINHNQGIVRQIFKKGRGWFPRIAAGQIA